MSEPEDWSARMIHGDCIEAMAALEAGSIDAVVCDPPYGLEFMGKEWDTFAKGGASFSPLSYAPDSRPLPSFGKGLEAMRAFQVWTTGWSVEALRVLKPGGHLLAFGGTRTYHRLGAGIEEAGFEIRDSLHWIYGSGFPKSLDVSKAVDAALSADREVIGYTRGVARPGFAGERYGENGGEERSVEISVPRTAEAAEWDGWGLL